MQCADISNPCRLWPVSRLWSLRCCEEFFRQGDAERELGLPLTPFCDRFNVTVAKLQTGFYRLVAEPLYKEWHRFLDSPLSEAILANLYSNQAAWEQEVLQQELIPAEATQEEQEDTTAPCMTTGVIQAAGPTLTRRLSLPVSDPLHRIFDQMIQPDTEQPRTTHLRRNFSLTDRRRSSLLRGLHSRSSLKPLRGRVVRPASVCLENTENLRLQQRTLQNRENIENSMEVEPAGLTSSKPDLFQVVEKENACLHASYERLTRRRGSAPPGVLGESLRPPLSATPPQLLRQHNNCLSAPNRRGSLPTDLLNESLPKQLRNRMIQNAASASKRPGLLRRRSMGPELLTLGSQQVIKERQLVQKYINLPL